MSIVTLWILYHLNAPIWIWAIAIISILIRETESLLKLIDRLKK